MLGLFETDIEKAITKASKISKRYTLRIFILNKDNGVKDYIEYTRQPEKQTDDFILTSKAIVVEDVNGEIKTARVKDIVLVEYY